MPNISPRILVSPEDQDLLSAYKWRICNQGYARATTKTQGIRGERIRLHRLVAARMGIKGGVDHINRNPLDNRRENLRPATRSQNQANRVVKNNLGFKGVCQVSSGRYSARIKYQGKTKYLGCFPDVLEAAKAYDKAAIELFGEYALTNEKLGRY